MCLMASHVQCSDAAGHALWLVLQSAMQQRQSTAPSGSLNFMTKHTKCTCRQATQVSYLQLEQFDMCTELQSCRQGHLQAACRRANAPAPPPW